MAKLSKHEMIMVLVNPSFTDAVIQVAKDNGAKGGTIISARGTGNKQAQNDYGLPITPDKELLMILANNKNKTNIINAIYKAAGIETNGMAIIFTLPVNNVLISKNKKIANKK